MHLNHVGIANKTEDEAVRFYKDFLGLERMRDFVVSPALSHQLFSIPGEIKVVVFGKDNMKVEVFILPEFVLPSPNILHFCLYLDNFQEIVESAGRAGVKVISGMHNEKKVYFIEDFSGNLIEIKPTA